MSQAGDPLHCMQPIPVFIPQSDEELCFFTWMCCWYFKGYPPPLSPQFFSQVFGTLCLYPGILLVVWRHWKKNRGMLKVFRELVDQSLGLWGDKIPENSKLTKARENNQDSQVKDARVPYNPLKLILRCMQHISTCFEIVISLP